MADRPTNYQHRHHFGLRWVRSIILGMVAGRVGSKMASVDNFEEKLPWSHSVTSHRHKWTHPALTPARQAGTRFTYPGGMEGW